MILTWLNEMVTEFAAKLLLSDPKYAKVGHNLSVCWGFQI